MSIGVLTTNRCNSQKPSTTPDLRTENASKVRVTRVEALTLQVSSSVLILENEFLVCGRFEVDLNCLLELLL
jgi:hypothetical protein